MWSWPHRQRKGHQVINHIYSQSSGRKQVIHLLPRGDNPVSLTFLVPLALSQLPAFLFFKEKTVAEVECTVRRTASLTQASITDGKNSLQRSKVRGKPS